MQIFNIICENPYGDNIVMTIAAKNQNDAISLFKKHATIESIEKVAKRECKEYVKDYKNHIKEVGYTSYDFSFRNSEYSFHWVDISKEGLINLYNRLYKLYMDTYFIAGGSIQYNIKHNIFIIKNITDMVKGLEKGEVLDTHHIYHGR